MATSWLDLMGEDSNLSMTSINSVTSLDDEKSRFDPEFDRSRQGVNLLFKKNIKIISDDSQSRKRRFQQIKSDDENDTFLPPKAKQRMNVNGDWKKRKKNDENGTGKTDFSHFLNWAKNDNLNESAVLNTKTIDNKKNINNDQNNNDMVFCGPLKTNGRSQRRKQYRVKRKKQHHPNEKKMDVEEIEIEQIKNEKEEEQKKEDQQKKEDEEEKEKVQLSKSCININKKRRITPTLQNVIFNKDLMLNKVPILRKKEFHDDSNKNIMNGPLFLNADQFEKLNGNKKKEETEKKEENEKEKKTMDESKENEEKNKNEENAKSEAVDDGVWGSKSLLIEENEDTPTSMSWANKLFGHEVKKNKILKEQEKEQLVEKKKKERIDEMRLDSILPPTMSSNKASNISSRESSISPITDTEPDQYILSPTETASISTLSPSALICPSLDAVEWREKQIKLGKETEGYMNMIKMYPNKDLRFRLNNNLVSTPNPREKIGKKRWVGKYQKWRIWLHEFDEKTEKN